MAFPTVASITETLFNAANTTAHLVTMPATVAVNDLLITIFTNDGGATVTTPSGWTSKSSVEGGVGARLSIYVKKADGTEDGTTVDFVTSAIERATAQVYRILAAEWSGTLSEVQVGTSASGTSTNPNPPTLTPTGGALDWLWLAITGYDGDGTVSAYPTSYTNGANAVGTPAASAAGTGSARRALNATSDDPATFTITASVGWVAQTLVVPPAAGAATQTLTGTLFAATTTWPTGVLSQGVPVAPSSLTATPTGTTTVDVAWTDNSTDETSFRIERSPNGTTGWVTAGTNSAGDVTFTDTGRTCGTQYFYRVFAVNAIGDSTASNTDDATTTACPPPTPSTGGNRMGGSGAIRKPPRNVGR